MQENDWQAVVELAAALNASEELQAEFREDPRAVLERYEIAVTDEELLAIRGILETCSESTTEMCVVPLPVARPHPHKNDDEEGH